MMPSTPGRGWLPVRRNRCFPQALEREFSTAGSSEVRSWVTPAQPGYIEAIYLLFLLHAGYQLVTRRLRIRRLAPFTVVRAVR